jgi:coproporphyrinogen III oxidase-like Fe-S oxidoreductase
VRWWNVKHPVRYTAMLESARSPAAARETLDEQARFTERIMLGVRMRAGLSVAELPPASQRLVPQLATWGLIEHADTAPDRVVLTQRGRLMADAVVRELLA